MAIPTVTIIHNEYGRQWREAISLRDFDPKKHVLAPEPTEEPAEKAFKASKPKRSRKTVVEEIEQEAADLFSDADTDAAEIPTGGYADPFSSLVGE